MKIIIAGGTGLIGKRLTGLLAGEGHSVIVLSRSPERAQKYFPEKVRCLLWDGLNTSAWSGELKDTGVLINLIGENIGAGRWTKRIKEEILRSRIEAGQAISRAIRENKQKPKLLIQSSATGYYGNENNKILDEASPAGQGFLAGVCVQWESSTQAVEDDGVKRCIIRIGPVLSPDGGALKKMVLPFKLFVGGPPGSGRQIFPWIHIDDAVNAIKFIADQRMDGIFNLVAPNPVTMKEFARHLGKALHRPGFMPIPAFVLKIIFGEMARETVLPGQNAVPKALLERGFKFRYSAIEDALSSFFPKK